MNSEQLKKQFNIIKEAIPGNDKKPDLFDRIRLYEEILGSQEFKNYKLAMKEGRESDAIEIYNQIPTERQAAFLRCYDCKVNYFDKLQDEIVLG